MSTVDYSIRDVEKVFRGINGEVKKVGISRLTAPGENYLSLVFRVDFEVEKDGKTKTISTVAKRLPLVDMPFDFNALAMENEIKWYSDILPMLKECGKEFGIDTDFYPKYLGGRFSLDPTKMEVDKESVLLLANLITEGYSNEDRYIGFDLTSARALLRALASFHALPLVMKFKKPESFKILKDYLENTHSAPPSDFDNDGPQHSDVPKKGPPDDKLLDKMLEIPACQPYRANIEAMRLKPHGPQAWQKQGLEPWNTVVHCDYWVNNVMVQPREGQEPLVKIVDFQMCTYSSYAKDLVFFLLSSIRNDIQKHHFDDLLRYYYDQLTSILNRVGIPELRLSYEDYLAEVKHMASECEVSHSIFFSTVIFGVKGTGPDILTGEIGMFDHLDNLIDNMSEKQKEKLAIMVELSVERGWL